MAFAALGPTLPDSCVRKALLGRGGGGRPQGSQAVLCGLAPVRILQDRELWEHRAWGHSSGIQEVPLGKPGDFWGSDGHLPCPDQDGDTSFPGQHVPARAEQSLAGFQWGPDLYIYREGPPVCCRTLGQGRALGAAG